MSVVPPPGVNTRFSRTLCNALSHNALRFSAVCYRLSCAAERAFSPCGKARFMSRYGTSGTAIRAIWQCRKAFFVLLRHISPRPSTLKTPPRHPIFRSLTHISHHIRSSFPISRCQYFLLLKTHKYTFPQCIPVSSYLPRRPPSSHFSPLVSPKTPPRHPFSCSITHIFHHIRSSFPISRCQTFLLLKTHKYTFP